MDRVGTQGWYFVSFSESLRRNEVRSVRLFGTDWVLHRTRSGHVRLAGGRDVDQPALPTIERLGNIWAWYGATAPGPFLAVKEVDPGRYANHRGAIHHADGHYRAVLERMVGSYQFRPDRCGQSVVTIFGPGTAVWRVMDPDDGIGAPPLVMVVLTVTPVEPADTLVAWRTIVHEPDDRALTLAMGSGFELDVVGAPAAH
jgi:hypothetical protein